MVTEKIQTVWPDWHSGSSLFHCLFVQEASPLLRPTCPRTKKITLVKTASLINLFSLDHDRQLIENKFSGRTAESDLNDMLMHSAS